MSESLKITFALCLLCGVVIYSVFLFIEAPKEEAQKLLPDAEVQDFIKKMAAQEHMATINEVNSSTISLYSFVEEVVGDSVRFELFNHRKPSSTDSGNYPHVLVLTLLRDSSSWGESFEAYLGMINQLNYPKEHLSLGLLVNSVEEYERMKAAITRNYDYQLVKYRHVTIILRHQEFALSREDRHLITQQKIRRRTISRMRNLLLYSTLRTQDSVLWIDSDIIKIPPDTLMLMLNSSKDIITTRCRKGRFIDYDLNAWKGPRSKPTPEELDAIREGGFWEPKPAAGTKHVSQLRDPEHPEPDFFVEVDSVGGTMLFVKGDIHRQGIGFTTSYIIGTEWEMEEGWDGIETEGICYLARPLGYKCWAMPNVVVEHVDR